MLAETPGLRDFLGCETFSDKTGTILGKMRQVVIQELEKILEIT